MKKALLINFILFLFLGTFQTAKAQVENDPCSAPCLSFSGTTIGKLPDANGFSPNTNLPCGSGTSEDNPTWYTFVTSETNFKIDITVNNCTGGSGSVQITIFEGDDCSSLSGIGCLNCITNGTLIANTLPCKQYWLQIDGCAEAVCDFKLDYDPKQLLDNIPAPIITGEKSVCLDKSETYSAVITGNCLSSDYIWSILPEGKAIISNNGDGTVDVKWTSIGTFKLTAKPMFFVNCPPQTITTTEYTVYVTDKLKDTTCMATFCCENEAFDFPLLPCIKMANPDVLGNSTPLSIPINQACGTTKTYAIPYQMGCTGNINLIATIKDNIPMVFTTKINNSTGKNGAIDLTVTNGKMPTFLWSNGATIEDILNLAPGKYCVNVTDIEGCSKYECFVVKDVTSSAETETSRAISIFPNPVNDVLFIKIEENIILTKIELLDTKGSILSIFSSETRQINMNNLPSAVYFLKCYTKDDFVVKRIVR